MSSMTLRSPEEDAKERDVRIVLPESPQDLFIDIDSEEDEGIMLRHLLLFATHGIRISIVKETQSPSKEPGHKHFYLHVDPNDLPLSLNPLIRILLQAVLGSDRKRELFSYLRLALQTGHEPTVFFESKD